MRNNSVKFVQQVAAGRGEREGTEKTVDTKKNSGEDYVRKFKNSKKQRERQDKKRRKKKMR